MSMSEENQEDAGGESEIMEEQNSSLFSPAAPELNSIEVLSPRPVSAPSLSASFVAWRAFVVFSLFGAAGFLIAWREVSRRTLRHIFTSGGLDLQEQAAGLPVPQLVNWNPHHLEAMMLARDLQGITLALAAIGVGLLLLLGSLYALNPTFRLFRTLSVFDLEVVGRVAKVGLVFLTPALLFCAVTFLMDHGDSAPLWAIRIGVLSLSLWTAFHRDGQVGDLTLPSSKPRKSALSSLLISSLAFTLAVMLIANAYPHSLAESLEGFASLGTFNRQYWMQTGGIYLRSATLIFGFVGLMMLFISYPIKWWANAIFLVIYLFGGAYASNWYTYSPKSQWGEYDYPWKDKDAIPLAYNPDRAASGVPEGEKAVEYFREKAGIPEAKINPESGRNLILFSRFGRTVIRQPDYNMDSLPLDAKGREAALTYLKRKNYQSAYSWMAIRYAYNVSIADFDVSSAIETLLLDQERCPHLAQSTGTLRQMLFTCAASPQNLALLDRYANRDNFAFPDRTAYRMIGELYERMGEPTKALTWYGYAEMPKSFLKKVQNEKPMFKQGTVTGRLILNGKPIPNTLVGVVPVRMNGLPKDLSPVVLSGMQGIRSAYFASPQFPPFHVMPYSLRFLSTSVRTDANGNFQLDHLTEGEYQMICALPENVKMELGEDVKQLVKNAPTAFVVNYTQPKASLGEIAITSLRKP